MAVTYSSAMKTLRMQAVADGIDVGAGAGTMEIGTTAMAVTIVTFQLTEPCGSVTGSVLTFDFDPDVTASASNAGTAITAQIKNGSGTVVISGLTVGTAGTDVILDSISIGANQVVIMGSGSITHGT